jgi:hypothetical protein
MNPLLFNPLPKKGGSGESRARSAKLLGLAKTFIQSLRRIEEMKKLFAVLLVLLMAAPAIAADWNFYGSARVTTFYTVRDSNALDNPDTDLDHRLQNNSRIGVNVKADKVSGKVELALRASGADSGVSGDNSVNTRLAYGDWNFSDNGYLRVGKELSVLDMTDVSNQVFNSDNDLTGLAPSANRTSGVGIQIGGFGFRLVQPTTNTPGAWGTAGNNTVQNDAKWPKVEAAYTLPIGKDFSFGVGGGFQNVQGTNPVNGNMENINSYMGEAKFLAAIGAFYAKAAGFYGVNMYNANWGTQGYGQTAAYSNVAYNGDDRKDTTSYGVGGSLGLNFTDTIAFEAGGGWRDDDNDLAASGNVSTYNVYAQMTYKFAPGCKITPEVGYFANQDSFTTGNSGGYDWYAGLQWRIDF